jgi:hypothetical protein
MNESFAGTWRAERLQVLALEARMSAAGCADEMRAALNKTAEQLERLAEHEVEADRLRKRVLGAGTVSV